MTAVLDKYTILETLGQGGFSTVYKAEDRVLGRLVALKVLDPLFLRDAEFVRRFQQEARTVAQLKHPHIVTLYDIVESGGQLALAMEYLPGPDLGRLLREGGALPPARALPLLRQVAAALDYAHGRQVVHRDLKPANIIISPPAPPAPSSPSAPLADGGEQATLTDFGLVKVLSTSLNMSSAGRLVGSPEYMAPEQCDPNRSDEVGPASDRYALGILAYQMLTGRVPFQGATPATINAHLNLTPPDPRRYAGALPPAAGAVLLQMLAKAPAERYATAQAFVTALGDACTGEEAAPSVPVSASPVSPASPAPAPDAPDQSPQPGRSPGRRQGVMLALALVAALLAGGGYLWVSGAIVGGVLGWGVEMTALPVITQAPVTVAMATPTPKLMPTETPTPDKTTVALIVDARATAQAAGLTTVDLAVNPIDQAVYVFVPAGEFVMGAGNGAERPVHTVELDSFWIMRTEVTNGMYRRCVSAGVCIPPNNNIWNDARYMDHPVTDVDWTQASAYAGWAGGHLPTEAEWEKACRGGDTRPYPWGNAEPEPGLLNFGASGINETTAVGSFPTGASPYGALDMAGNVWEWTADWYGADYYGQSPETNPLGPANGNARVLRGGSQNSDADSVRCAHRSGINPDLRSYGWGFRVVSAGF